MSEPTDREEPEIGNSSDLVFTCGECGGRVACEGIGEEGTQRPVCDCGTRYIVTISVLDLGST